MTSSLHSSTHRETRAQNVRPPIDGLRLRRLEPRNDSRGAFTEVFSSAWTAAIRPEQWSLVHSMAGTLRGMHLHRRHDEYFLLVTGRAWVGLRDVRPGSPTEGRSCLVEVCGDDPTVVTFPRGIVHGWCFGEASIHVQATSEPYASYAHDDNLGCHWNDPELDIKWPIRPTRVSPRADAFPSLRALIAETRRLDPGFRY